MPVTNYRVSDRGQMSLPAQTRRRWDIVEGGAVEITDLGSALVIVPAASGGLRSLVRTAIDEAGGYAALARSVSDTEPELA
jgi:AbrB family looped-hinge helix DNA binding protein